MVWKVPNEDELHPNVARALREQGELDATAEPSAPTVPAGEPVPRKIISGQDWAELRAGGEIIDTATGERYEVKKKSAGGFRAGFGLVMVAVVAYLIVRAALAMVGLG